MICHSEIASSPSISFLLSEPIHNIDLKGQCHEILVSGLFIKQLLLVLIGTYRKDIKFCWIFVELFLFVIDMMNTPSRWINLQWIFIMIVPLKICSLKSVKQLLGDDTPGESRLSCGEYSGESTSCSIWNKHGNRLQKKILVTKKIDQVVRNSQFITHRGVLSPRCILHQQFFWKPILGWLLGVPVHHRGVGYECDNSLNIWKKNLKSFLGMFNGVRISCLILQTRGKNLVTLSL